VGLGRVFEDGPRGRHAAKAEGLVKQLLAGHVREIDPVIGMVLLVRIVQAACGWRRAVTASMPAIHPATERPMASG
jgi:hypothetical protein